MSLNVLYSFILLIFGLALVVLGIISLLSKNKNFNKIVFSTLMLFSGMWAVSYYFWLSSNSYKVAFFWVGMLNIGSTFIPILYYHWITILINKKRKYLFIFGYILTFSFSLFAFSNLYFTELRSIAGFEFWPKAGFLYIYYIIFIYGGFYLMGALDILHSIFKEKNKVQKNKYKVIFVAFFISLGAGTTNFPLWFGINFLPYGNFLLIFAFIFLISYSISKHNLMNMQSLRIQLVVGLLLTISFVEIFFTESLNESIFHIFNFLIFLFFSILLIKISREEKRQSERLRKIQKRLKKANKKLEKTAKKLKELDKAKNEFLSVATHQLRTPATAVKGYTAMILDGNFGKCDKRAIEALEKVYKANERMTNLIEDLLTTSRIESGHLKYEFTKVNIQEILEELESTFAIRTKENKLKFSVKCPKKALPKIVADKNKIREVISNIIDNAVKYTPKGSVKILAEKEEGFIKISVEDTGRGMTERTKSNLFEKFTRGQESSSEVEGTGLGLFVVKSLVEKHGGTITAYSEGLDKGSKFIMKLPIKREIEDEDEI
ncbi:MAG: GHKL domain-containing protein [Candidatus Moranbacteria bacterium]|nr:GHKL domain-containing protein [Candidatus Moranbacteria bacterium]